MRLDRVKTSMQSWRAAAAPARYSRAWVVSLPHGLIWISCALLWPRGMTQIACKSSAIKFSGVQKIFQTRRLFPLCLFFNAQEARAFRLWVIHGMYPGRIFFFLPCWDEFSPLWWIFSQLIRHFFFRYPPKKNALVEFSLYSRNDAWFIGGR